MTKLTPEGDIDLREAIRAILFEEPPAAPAWEKLVSIPKTRGVTENEAVSRLWGFAYGLAYGIVKFEHAGLAFDKEAAERAFDAAYGLFQLEELLGLELVRLFEAGKIAVEEEV